MPTALKRERSSSPSHDRRLRCISVQRQRRETNLVRAAALTALQSIKRALRGLIGKFDRTEETRKLLRKLLAE
jgi:hypothetical protein